ncbi:hypothetical protein XHV734_4990 [Xanthomonas hortorum pv. vitians]|nr:hypothetical protein XHV734_4990 [Xanthomonas hortorum pv. vitians]
MLRSARERVMAPANCSDKSIVAPTSHEPHLQFTIEDEILGLWANNPAPHAKELTLTLRLVWSGYQKDCAYRQAGAAGVWNRHVPFVHCGFSALSRPTAWGRVKRIEMMTGQCACPSAERR